MKKIINAKVVTPYRILEGYEVAYDGTKIVEVAQNVEADEVIDAKGLYLVPGFIDLHFHGGVGFNYETADPEALKKAAYEGAKLGTTTIIAGVSCGKPEMLNDDMYKMMQNISEYGKQTSGPDIYGIHLEGPWMCDGLKVFDENGNKLLTYEKDVCEELVEKVPGLKVVTVAPNVNNARWFTRYLVEHGIKVSLGHCGFTTYEDVMDCVESGANQVTHVMSSTEGFYRDNGIRRLGLNEAGFTDDLYIELLTDGVHMDPNMINYIYRIRGVEQICLASDSHFMEKDPEDVAAGVKAAVRNIGTRFACCGWGEMAYIVRCCLEASRVPFVDAIRMATLNPAKALGIESFKGKIAPGFDADLLLIDEDINISYVVARGEELVNKL